MALVELVLLVFNVEFPPVVVEFSAGTEAGLKQAQTCGLRVTKGVIELKKNLFEQSQTNLYSLLTVVIF